MIDMPLNKEPKQNQRRQREVYPQGQLKIITSEYMTFLFKWSEIETLI